MRGPALPAGARRCPRCPDRAPVELDLAVGLASDPLVRCGPECRTAEAHARADVQQLHGDHGGTAGPSVRTPRTERAALSGSAGASAVTTASASLQPISPGEAAQSCAPTCRVRCSQVEAANAADAHALPSRARRSSGWSAPLGHVLRAEGRRASTSRGYDPAESAREGTVDSDELTHAQGANA